MLEAIGMLVAFLLLVSAFALPMLIAKLRQEECKRD